MTTRPPYPLEEARKLFPPMWTIYDHPRDHPDSFVVRLWWGETPEPDAHPYPTLVQAREHVAEHGGCFRIPREPNDDPAVLETWL